MRAGGGRSDSFSGVRVIPLPGPSGTSWPPRNAKGTRMVSDVVTEYHKALGDQDFEAARRLLEDDLRFKGPFE